MPKVNYTESDLWNKEGLERLFWIEIAKRKSRLWQAGTFSKLVALRGKLELFFKSYEAELEESFEDGADAFFDTIQFRKKIEESVFDHGQVNLLRVALDLYEEEAQKIVDNLSYYEGFRLADFSVVTDLEALHDWWVWINSWEGQHELGTTGKFSSVGDVRSLPATEEIWFDGDDSQTINVGDLIDTVSTFMNPVRIPLKVHVERVNVFSTDDHKVIIDGLILKDHLVLKVDLNKPLPSMRQIELKFRLAQIKTLAERNFANLQAGIISEDILSENARSEVSDIQKLILTLPEEHELMVQQTSAAPLIYGLYCWDFVIQGKTDAQACKLAVEKLLSISGEPLDIERRVLYGLQKVVRPKIEAYEPCQLPWNYCE